MINHGIDRIYISKDQKIESTFIFPNPLSDHDGITMISKISKNKSKDKGYLKLHTSIIKHENFKIIFDRFRKD